MIAHLKEPEVRAVCPVWQYTATLFKADFP